MTIHNPAECIKRRLWHLEDTWPLILAYRDCGWSPPQDTEINIVHVKDGETRIQLWCRHCPGIAMIHVSVSPAGESVRPNIGAHIATTTGQHGEDHDA